MGGTSHQSFAYFHHSFLLFGIIKSHFYSYIIHVQKTKNLNWHVKNVNKVNTYSIFLKLLSRWKQIQVKPNQYWEKSQCTLMMWFLFTSLSDGAQPSNRILKHRQTCETLDLFPLSHTEGPCLRKTVLNLRQTHHVICSTALFQEPQSLYLVPDFTGGSTVWRGQSERHLAHSFDVPVLRYVFNFRQDEIMLFFSGTAP